MADMSHSSARTWALLATVAAAVAWGGPASLPSPQVTVPESRSQESLDLDFLRAVDQYFVQAETVNGLDVITRQIAQDANGDLWLATFDVQAFDDASELPTGGHIPTLIDANGHLWIGGIAGLHHYDGARLRQVTQEPA